MALLVSSDGQQLLGLARTSIQHGFVHQQPLVIDPLHYDPALAQQTACFVTLYQQKKLRGCVGCLTARQALCVEVCTQAFYSAYGDKRFQPVTEMEIAALEISLSVLTPEQPLVVESEQALYEALVPGEDGLILSYGAHRAVYLPSVWSQLPTPQQFVCQLKRKAGLAEDAWSQEMRFSRYGSQHFAE